MTKRKIRVGVIFGGKSGEHEVSLASAQSIMRAMDKNKYEVVPIGVTSEGRWLTHGDPLKALTGGQASMPQLLESGYVPDSGSPHRELIPGTETSGIPDVDVIFPVLHGTFGEDGTVQGLLELAGIPYTGSGVLASALAMDKLRSRQLFGFNDIPVPAYLAVTRERAADLEALRAEVATTLSYPCVVKPNALGSSIGVTIVRDPAALPAALDVAFAYGALALVEEFIRGTEITCGVLEDPTTGRPHALPLIEIVPQREFFTYEAKYTPGASEEICPARLPEQVAARAAALAVRAHEVLGCRDMSRVDMFVRGGQVIVLEVNTIPGMTGVSLLPQAARAAGIEFPALLDRLITGALQRRRRSSG